jgi:hypothetical protein
MNDDSDSPGRARAVSSAPTIRAAPNGAYDGSAIGLDPARTAPPSTAAPVRANMSTGRAEPMATIVPHGLGLANPLNGGEFAEASRQMGVDRLTRSARCKQKWRCSGRFSSASRSSHESTKQ